MLFWNKVTNCTLGTGDFSYMADRQRHLASDNQEYVKGFNVICKL